MNFRCECHSCESRTAPCVMASHIKLLLSQTCTSRHHNCNQIGSSLCLWETVFKTQLTTGLLGSMGWKICFLFFLSAKEAVGKNFKSKANPSSTMFTMFIPVGHDTVCEMTVFHNNYEREKNTCGINITHNKKQQYMLENHWVCQN